MPRLDSFRSLGLLSLIVLLGVPARADECIFVATAGFAAITVHDVARDRLTGFLPVGERPAAVAVSADRRRAWSANQEDHTVSVIDLQIPDAFEPCGGDVDNDAVVTPADVRQVIAELFFFG